MAAAEDQATSRQDLLPSPITTQRRGSNSQALVAVGSSEPSSTPAANPSPDHLTICPVLQTPLNVTDLPIKKRILVILQASRDRNPQFICSVCGRAFTSYHALGEHNGHCRRSEKKRRQSQTRMTTKEEGGFYGAAVVVYEPIPPP